MNKKEYLIALLILIITLVIAIVLDSGLIVFLGLIISAIVAFGKMAIGSTKGKDKVSSIQVLCFIGSIASIFMGTIWYLGLSLGIISLIESVKLIRKTGGRMPKATMIISIIGIVSCIYIYVRTIATILYDVY